MLLLSSVLVTGDKPLFWCKVKGRGGEIPVCWIMGHAFPFLFSVKKKCTLHREQPDSRNPTATAWLSSAFTLSRPADVWVDLSPAVVAHSRADQRWCHRCLSRMECSSEFMNS